MTDWHKVCLALLEHFDEAEGTTYLYRDGPRTSFARQFDNDEAEVLKMLNEYHEPKQ